jgi:RNA recognition motif-containing protein
VRIFVGGLAPEVDDEDLDKHFSQYGEIKEATVIRDKDTGDSRKFGFVMFNTADGESRVMADSHTVRGRKVTVRLHQDSSSGPPENGRRDRDSEANSRVFIGRLDSIHTKETLREKFEQRFGRITEVFLAATNKFGFITFESGSAARDALNAKTIDVDGKTVIIKEADPMQKGGSRRSPSRSRSRSPPRGQAPPPGYPGYGYPGYPGYPGYAYPPGYGYPGYPPAYGYPPSYPPGYGYPPGYNPYGGYPPAYGYPPAPTTAYSYPPPSQTPPEVKDRPP